MSPTPSQRLPISSSQETFQRRTRSSADKVPSKTIIREIGLKVTDQRILILDMVRKGSNHFTAQDIFERVSRENTDIGFATVYRFLRVLSENQFVSEVRIGGMPARYEWAGKQHHDHLTCSSCGKIVEFENAEIERLQEKIARQHGFILNDHLMELFGTCSTCASKNEPRTVGHA